ncbi:uncharacterized protein TNIN_92011 [Trichonephila inaurata madagascariensis]|uniref:Uncharacterized protein n=1 Tax=Trichonephila inaurata madagascariensis TaxID=2747483 RepID=A0A8X6X3U0_9ARAC|nr:uncharacterized protein TNIN_92011 [Trichonephila inaurata madagascariensis]
MSSESNKETKKKPVKGYIVPSRYKQAAKNFSSQASNSKDSDIKCAESVLQSTINTKLGDSIFPKHGSTKKFSSTPAIEGRHALPSIDASAITDVGESLIISRDTATTLPPTTSTTPKKTAIQKHKGKEESVKTVGSVNATKQPKIKTSQAAPNIKKEIDLLYVEYLQAKLLESNAKKAVEIRSKNALEKIHKVWSFIQILLAKNAHVRRELDFMTYLLTLHAHLKKQEQMLLPALETISVLDKQYEEIATSVYSVQHKLGVKDIKLPGTGHEEEIAKLLERVTAFFDTILNSVKDCNEVISKAEAADAFVKQGKLITKEIKRGVQLVSEATDLLLSETSLKIAASHKESSHNLFLNIRSRTHYPSIPCLRNSSRQPFRGFSSSRGNPFQTEIINLQMKEETPPDTKQKKKKSEGCPVDRGKTPARETRRKFRSNDSSPRGQLPGFSYQETVVKLLESNEIRTDVPETTVESAQIKPEIAEKGSGKDGEVQTEENCGFTPNRQGRI